MKVLLCLGYFQLLLKSLVTVLHCLLVQLDIVLNSALEITPVLGLRNAAPMDVVMTAKIL